jgi:hypothetical protein
MNVAPCPECGKQVVECDNAVRLNYPSEPYDEAKAPWTLMTIGASAWGSVGSPSLDGKGHSLHEHQPEGSVMA